MVEIFLGIVCKYGEIIYLEMNDIVEKELDGKFDGKILWYVVIVKLDLEVCGILECIFKISFYKLWIS